MRLRQYKRSINVSVLFVAKPAHQGSETMDLTILLPVSACDDVSPDLTACRGHLYLKAGASGDYQNGLQLGFDLTDHGLQCQVGSYGVELRKRMIISGMISVGWGGLATVRRCELAYQENDKNCTPLRKYRHIGGGSRTRYTWS